MQMYFNIAPRDGEDESLTLEYRPKKAGEATGYRAVSTRTGSWEDMVDEAEAVVRAASGYWRVAAEVNRLPAGMAELRVTREQYAAPDEEEEEGEEEEESDSDLGSEDNPTYTSSSSTYEAPVLTHPRYKGIGSPAADALKALIDGAKMDDPLSVGGQAGRVRDFIKGGLAQEVYDEFISKGVYAYLEASTECTCRFRGHSNRYTPGKIAHPPGGVRTPSGRNWLCTGTGQERVGNEVWQTASFRLSGPDGWNQKLYK